MAGDQDVREIIVNAATEVFKKWGMKKTTMEDIAREAGKGKATLYYYFKNKDEVFREVISRQIAEIQQITDAALKGVESAADRLKIHLTTMYSEARDRVNIFNILKLDVREDKQILYELRESLDMFDIRFNREIIEYGIERGEFVAMTEKELTTIAYAISSTLRGSIINLLIEQDLPDENDRMDSIVDYLIRGLQK